MLKIRLEAMLAGLAGRFPRPRGALSFALPVIFENIIVFAIGMVVAAYVGKLNGTSLAAMGTGSSVIAMLTAFFCIITISSSILTARLIGSGDAEGTSKAANQSLLFSIASGVVVCAVLALLAAPVMHLLIPSAEPQLFDEAVAFLRLSCISYPFYNVFATGSGLLRAIGSSGAAMVGSVFLNVSYLAFVIVAITVLNLGLNGVGYALILARVLAMLLIILFMSKSHRFHLSLKDILIPDVPMIKRLLRLGLPASLEQLFVQSGYLIANSLIVGLGTHEAAVFQVANSTHPFSSVVQAICSTAVITLVGQALGESDAAKAKKNVRTLWIAGMLASAVLGIVSALLGPHITSLFSNDPSVIAESAEVLWILLAYNVFAISINVIDPTLRTGGDARFVMITSACCVWLIRLPLTYLFCYVLSLGVWGIYLANIINLAMRAALGLIRYFKGKWTRIAV